MMDGELNLIKRAIRGDASAFGSLYDYYQPKIYRFVLIKVSHREEAEDLTHQVFLSAWQNIRGYKSLGHPFSSWLYQIARNKVIDFYRTQKLQVDLEDADEQYFSTDEKDINLSVDIALQAEEVVDAIRSLKQVYQDVIIMRFVEDLTPKEVAKVLGKSEGAVKLIQHRAIKELQHALQDSKYHAAL